MSKLAKSKRQVQPVLFRYVEREGNTLFATAGKNVHAMRLIKESTAQFPPPQGLVRTISVPQFSVLPKSENGCTRDSIPGISHASIFVKPKHFQPSSLSDAPIRYSSKSSKIRNRSWKAIDVLTSRTAMGPLSHPVSNLRRTALAL